MDEERNIKSVQEQAAASWINYLNQKRLQSLQRNLKLQDMNLEEALKELESLKKSLQVLINSDRGGTLGMHGFIAERMEVFFGNSRSLVAGGGRQYTLLDDNGPVDYIKNGVNYQQKFVLRNLSLDAVAKYLEKYPDFLKNGGKFNIPKDHYEKIKRLWELPETEANKLRREEYRQWKYIRKFLQEKGIRIQDLEPALNDYRDVQAENAGNTIEKEEKNIKKIDQERRAEFHQKSKPSIKEAGKATAVSAVLEGGAAFCMAVYRKRKEGKELAEFDYEDWKELGLDTAKGTIKGGVRGASVYVMTNVGQIDGAIASALVTAVLGMTAEAAKWKRGEISQEEFCIRSEIYCLDATISALSSVLGQALIPAPVLGAVVGSVVGRFMYQIARETMSKEEQRLIAQYKRDRKVFDRILETRYLHTWEQVQAEMRQFDTMVAEAFSEDTEAALRGSVRLAECLISKNRSVSSKQTLGELQDIDTYFLG